MQVTVKYFSVLNKITGKKEETFNLPDNATGDTLLDHLTTDYPGITPYNKYLRLAVNQEYRDFSILLQDRDEVVLITPVSGG